MPGTFYADGESDVVAETRCILYSSTRLPTSVSVCLLSTPVVTFGPVRGRRTARSLW